MLVLNKNQENTFTVTLSDVNFATFIFEFENYQTKEVITIPFKLIDVKEINNRYQDFTITALQSDLFDEDYWDYSIYGTNNAITYTNEAETIINTESMETLEIGKMYVKPYINTNVVYENKDEIKVYSND